MDNLIFSLDPGSIRTGWALMRLPERLVRAGLLLPDKQKSPSEFRIAAMCGGLWQLLDYWQPGVIVVEWTSGKVGRRHGSGGGAGLAIHGAATGALWREIIAWIRNQPLEKQIGTNVILVEENNWTRQVPKVDRIAAIAAKYPVYKQAEDSGGDIADAIGLALWWLREYRLRLAEAARV